MKKITLIILVFVTTIAIAQEKEENYPQDINKKTEIKINALTLIAAKWIDVSYERLIDEESSYGIAATINTDRDESDLNYSLTPFYRRYFSGNFARGFFVEGFGMLYSARDYYYDYYDYDHYDYYSNSDNFETGFGLGISIGGKFVSKKGFTTELVLGVGRNFSENSYDDAIGRVGISVGYRF
ncbi:DUF3575 domain-containing protein [Polaribacter sp. Asnod6-C07]|uniref:DUF3575 domain-containing protein n=1 Tax=Polaribacter sp. Asnod6-C07 TaxID=3160582 RepID=UPI0038687B83